MELQLSVASINQLYDDQRMQVHPGPGYNILPRQTISQTPKVQGPKTISFPRKTRHFDRLFPETHHTVAQLKVCSALGPLRVFCQLPLPLPVPFEQAVAECLDVSRVQSCCGDESLTESFADSSLFRIIHI